MRAYHIAESYFEDYNFVFSELTPTHKISFTILSHQEESFAHLETTRTKHPFPRMISGIIQKVLSLYRILSSTLFVTENPIPNIAYILYRQH